MVVQMASANTVLQTIVHDDKRGRVMALYTMAFLGVAPLGSLLAGGVATYVGAPLDVARGRQRLPRCRRHVRLASARLRPLIRPIYRAKGILPPSRPRACKQTEIITNLTGQ